MPGSGIVREARPTSIRASSLSTPARSAHSLVLPSTACELARSSSRSPASGCARTRLAGSQRRTSPTTPKPLSADAAKNDAVALGEVRDGCAPVRQGEAAAVHTAEVHAASTRPQRAAPGKSWRRGRADEDHDAREGDYGKGTYCPAAGAPTATKDSSCLQISELRKILVDSRDPAVLLDAWEGWHRVGAPGTAGQAVRPAGRPD